MSSELRWPALLESHDEIDIVVIESLDRWEKDHDLSGYDQPGMLVASDGRVYDLVFEPRRRRLPWFGPHGYQRPISRERTMTREELYEFVGPILRELGENVWQRFEQETRDLHGDRLFEFAVSYLREWT